MKTENIEKITELRHFLHMHPEISMREKGTMDIIEGFLKENTSFEVHRRDRWLYAVKREKTDQPPIAFRADMDALPIEEGIDLPWASQNPGTAHKCGHDGHMSALCGLALELDQTPLTRPVYLIFQHAEEIGEGGAECSELIDEQGISEIFAFHNRSGYPENHIVLRKGLIQAASEGLTICLQGKTSHASAPEDGVNPSNAIAELALYSQKFSTQHPDELTLCTIVGMHCGTDDFGISAGSGHICFTLRAERETVMKQMEQDLLNHAAQTAKRDGLQMTSKIRDRFPETRNHDAAVKRVTDAADALGLPVIEMPEAWRASEDFGHYLKKCPGALFYIGNGESYPPLHTRPYDFNNAILPTAVDMFLCLATDCRPVNSYDAVTIHAAATFY